MWRFSMVFFFFPQCHSLGVEWFGVFSFLGNHLHVIQGNQCIVLFKLFCLYTKRRGKTRGRYLISLSLLPPLDHLRELGRYESLKPHETSYM